MDISTYETFFHDGTIFDIIHNENRIEISMCSSEMDEDDLQDDLPLSDDGSIQGKLYIQGVKGITINEVPFSGFLKKKFQYAKIFDLEIGDNVVMLDVVWSDYSSPQEEGFSSIGIQAEKIWWETIPNLEELYS